jgi:hypothetical protein
MILEQLSLCIKSEMRPFSCGSLKKHGSLPALNIDSDTHEKNMD